MKGSWSCLRNEGSVFPAPEKDDDPHLIAFTGHGKRWKAYRKYANSGFSKTAVLKYHGGQTKDVHVFLQRLLNSPEDFAKQLNMLVGMIIMRITYGYQVQEAGDPFVTISDEAIASMSTTGVAGRYLVDSYPFLRFLPGYLAREEMDRVVGTDRLPTMSDRPKLPYLECILLETMRWYPVTPLTVPHRVEREDMYQGYRIPANSTVFANIYAITRDERIFPNPEAFISERFDGTQPGPTPLDPREFVFGIGRRICPGNTVADATIFLVMANLVATMDITKAKDENGHEIEPKL
ncbi:cytochrome p450 [Rhizoctonia solani]|uniref:Cytochrome p450 n=1 Tax=Rhizoctonia solani TaxID=456999 RepID=A0A8H7IB76_9AGAM|nr:cytochrome p450 [Rhizoctonia solani]